MAASTAWLSLRSPSPALGQAMNHSGGDRTGLIEIGSDEERQAFRSLACCCGGCPHEALLTCTCAYADRYRDDIRGMIGRGMSLEQIKDEWEKRYGADALTVPRNRGANRLLYVAPLVLIVGAAAIVITALRRFRRREDEKSRVALAGGGTSSAEDDKYAKKLDEELRQLDREE